MITDGKILKNERLRLGITPTQAAKVLERKDRNSIYKMVHSRLSFDLNQRPELDQRVSDLELEIELIKEQLNI